MYCSGVQQLPDTLPSPHAQAAFRGAAQRWHPDHVGPADKQRASEHFRQAIEAYTVLRDDRKRADYDHGIF